MEFQDKPQNQNPTHSRESIWILEDDPGVCFVYNEILSFRYNLTFFSSIQDFQQNIQSSTQLPHLIIADLALPDGHLLDLMPLNLTTPNPFPMIVISSTDDLDVLRSCFNTGAIDYLTKPFTKNELIVKVERIIHSWRQGFAQLGQGWNSFVIHGTDIPSPAEVMVDSIGLRISRKGKGTTQLTVKEYHIFSLLLKSFGRPVPRQHLKNEIWGNTKVSEKTLDVHLLHLRRKVLPLYLQIAYVSPHQFQLGYNTEA